MLSLAYQPDSPGQDDGGHDVAHDAQDGEDGEDHPLKPEGELPKEIISDSFPPCLEGDLSLLIRVHSKASSSAPPREGRRGAPPSDRGLWIPSSARKSDGQYGNKIFFLFSPFPYPPLFVLLTGRKMKRERIFQSPPKEKTFFFVLEKQREPWKNKIFPITF